MQMFCVLLLVFGLALGQDINCDAISKKTKDFVDNGIKSGLVFMISKTTCPYCIRAKNTFKDIGFREDDLKIVEVDDFPNKSEIQDYNWCLTGARTFPRVWANGKVVGGSDNTKEGYWSGELIDLAAHSRKEHAAEEFVQQGIEWSKNNRYFMISKEQCGFCVFAKMCFDRKGVDKKNLKIDEINSWSTHDQIKAYAGKISGETSTPRIWYNGKLIGGYMDLKAHLGC